MPTRGPGRRKVLRCLTLTGTIQYCHWWPWDIRYKFAEDINLGETTEYLGGIMVIDRIQNYFEYCPDGGHHPLGKMWPTQTVMTQRLEGSNGNVH